jgi:hypothetical protein
MKIVLDSDTSDCPGAVCKILNESETKSILVQTDYDAPGVASSFGWNIRSVKNKKKCDHRHTDGTIDCPDCGVAAIQFISSAIEYINENDGATADDPGYFD